MIAAAGCRPGPWRPPRARRRPRRPTRLRSPTLQRAL